MNSLTYPFISPLLSHTGLLTPSLLLSCSSHAGDFSSAAEDTFSKKPSQTLRCRSRSPQLRYSHSQPVFFSSKALNTTYTYICSYLFTCLIVDVSCPGLQVPWALRTNDILFNSQCPAPSRWVPPTSPDERNSNERRQAHASFSYLSLGKDSLAG